MCMFAQSVFNRRKTPQCTTEAKVLWEKKVKCGTLKIKTIFSPSIFTKLAYQWQRIPPCHLFKKKGISKCIRIYFYLKIIAFVGKNSDRYKNCLRFEIKEENFRPFFRRGFVQNRMRKQSYGSNLSTGSCGEPQIIVEESTLGEEEAEWRRNESPPRCMDPDSPSLNPYLLSPWREARKHSLPTPQCTSGITASQVRLKLYPQTSIMYF